MFRLLLHLVSEIFLDVSLMKEENDMANDLVRKDFFLIVQSLFGFLAYMRSVKYGLKFDLGHTLDSIMNKDLLLEKTASLRTVQRGLKFIQSFLSKIAI
jgi:hypothetical protein